MVFSTDFLAWWGAAVATVVLVWDVVKWLKSGPVIRKRIQLNTYYPDSRVLSVTKLDNGESRELAPYCHIELVNVGSSPTTIMGIKASHKIGKAQGQTSFDGPTNFIPHYGKALPFILPQGEVWSCRVEMARLAGLAERGKPYIEIHLSHRNKPVVIWPKLKGSKNSW